MSLIPIIQATNNLFLILLSIIGFTHPALEPCADLIQEISAEYHINAQVIATVIMVESRGDNRAGNKNSGAACLMGVNPNVKGRPGAKQLMNDPRLCLEWGTRILREAMNRTGNLNDALRVYNVGLQGWRNCPACGQGMITLYDKYRKELWVNWGEESNE